MTVHNPRDAKRARISDELEVKRPQVDDGDAGAVAGGSRHGDGSHDSEDDSTTMRAVHDLCLQSGLPTAIIQDGTVGSSVHKLRSIFQRVGVRTSLLCSPRPAVSIYKKSMADCMSNGTAQESCDLVHTSRLYLVTMMGLHPQQQQLEQIFQRDCRAAYICIAFCQRLREVCSEALNIAQIRSEVETLEGSCKINLSCASTSKVSVTGAATAEAIDTNEHVTSSTTPADKQQQRMDKLIDVICHQSRNSTIQSSQLRRELELVMAQSSTLSNVLVNRFQRDLSCTITGMMFRPSSDANFDRITVYLYDPAIDTTRPSSLFQFLPSQWIILQHGIIKLVDEMMTTFWGALEHNGYICSSNFRQQLHGDLRRFLLWGICAAPEASATSSSESSTSITNDILVSQPIYLHAHFEPTSPLALYIHGRAGCGKSSFVRHFPPALSEAIAAHLDSNLMVRFIKQNLNKPHDVLNSDFELRPNNNDMSIMGIIQQRRMTRTQNKPGLVVLGMEEMPSDPDQTNVTQMIHQRFSGRHYSSEDAAANLGRANQSVPRNSDKRGIHKDRSIVTIYTSNYKLEEDCGNMLRRLPMFQTLSTITLQAISGQDQKQFYEMYLTRLVEQTAKASNVFVRLDGGHNDDDSDIRTIVQQIRMVGYYVRKMMQTLPHTPTLTVQVQFRPNDNNIALLVGHDRLELRKDPSGILHLHESDSHSHSNMSVPFNCRTVLDYWKNHILTPTVIVICNNPTKHQKLWKSIQTMRGAACLPQTIRPSQHKMMKNLYDSTQTTNLRDDLLALQRHNDCIAVAMECDDASEQWMIREMVEDTPSMTAFSSASSALQKHGLLFVIHIVGELTPEIQSRASLVMS